MIWQAWMSTCKGEGCDVEAGCLVGTVGSQLWGGRRAGLGCTGPETIPSLRVQAAGVSCEASYEARCIAFLDGPQHCQALGVCEACVPQPCDHLHCR